MGKIGNLGGGGKHKQDRISVFFAADVNYFQHLCVLLVSILESNIDETFSFYILTDKEDSPEHINISSLTQKYRNFEYRFIVIDDSAIEVLPLTIGHITQQTYYRFLIPQLVPELTKALYLDCDIVCEMPLRSLWDTPLDDYPLAGVACVSVLHQTQHLEKIGYTNKDQYIYINAGMLLINLTKWREEDIAVQCIENTKRFSSVFRYQDQDAVNFTLRNRIKLLNCTCNYCSDDSLISNILSPHIAHFNGPDKPWALSGGCRHKSASLYFKYLRKTPYRKKILLYRILIPVCKITASTVQFYRRCVWKLWLILGWRPQ